MKPSTTKMSSKGQVVIPEEIRRRLGLTPGARFIVVGDGDVIVLKKLTQPAMSEFDALITEARRSAEEAGMKPEDIEKAIATKRTVS